MTTLTGQHVPYIVRIETGTINRAIYQIAMLHNPAARSRARFHDAVRRLERPADLHVRRRLHGGWYRQGTSTGGVDDDVMLQRGYAVASATLNTFGNNCAERSPPRR